MTSRSITSMTSDTLRAFARLRQSAVTKYALAPIVALLALSGCDDSTGTEFRDYSNIIVDCEASGQCWAKDSSWDSWAAAITNQQIDDAVSAGILFSTRDTPAGDQCWELAGTDYHMCVVYLGTTKLVGFPVSEMLLTVAGQACWFEGEWTGNAEGGGYCYGILDGVAIRLDIDP